MAALDDLANLTRGEDEMAEVVALYVDLDRFKQVNDTHGHLVGDAVLRMAAERLRHRCRDQDVVARLGGDEFLVILRGVGVQDGAALAERMVAELEQPFAVEGRRLSVSASVGVAGAVIGALEPDELVNRADEALYAAKREGRGRAVSAI
jgi:diguanylate cyclase (GGDEF)-like protein